jgi:hypothetical protein
MFRNKYCTYDDIMDAVRIPLAEEGLTLFHDVMQKEGGEILATRLYHISGEFLESFFPMKVEKPTSQGMASANTYSKRQGICNLLGLAGDDDDDGNEASRTEKISKQQISDLEQMIGGDERIVERILKGYKIKTLNDLESKHYTAILNGVKREKGEKRETVGA